MNKQSSKNEITAHAEPVETGLALLRKPFEPHQISKLPKPTKTQTQDVKNDYSKGIRCNECGGWHHPKVIHLDYVGHAALTDRLLDVDPLWYWEPLATYENGLPAFDEMGGLWIRLHVLGHSRIGYGSADGKTGGDAKKEVIGDALRNAAMRFGAALDLWHKGDLHVDEPEIVKPPTKTELKAQIHEICHTINTMKDTDGMDHLIGYWKDNAQILKTARDYYPDLLKSAEESKEAAKKRFERGATNDECPL